MFTYAITFSKGHGKIKREALTHLLAS